MMAHYLRLRNAVTSWVKREEGAALAEYGLLVALIAVVAIVALTTLGGDIAAKFTELSGTL